MRAALYPDPPYPFWGFVALTCAAAAGIGVLTVVSPVAGALPVGALAVLLLLATGPRLPSLFLTFLTGVLFAYAVLGRGGAYIGIAPVYIGDIGLVLAFLTIVVTLHRAQLQLLHWLLIAFAAWGVVRTVPYLSRDGIDALRDDAIWAYAAYAFAISFSLRREHFPRLLSVYRRILPLLVFWVPIAAITWQVARTSIPAIPSSRSGYALTNSATCSFGMSHGGEPFTAGTMRLATTILSMPARSASSKNRGIDPS